VGEIMDYKRFLGSKVGWVPALRWIPAYSTRRFGLDLIAGLSLAAFVIPESLAYASLAQLPPVTGLYCYLVAGIVYALFGTSGQLAVGPTSALAIVLASSVAAMGGDDPSRAVAIGSAVALMVGMICVAGRFVGLANAAYFISNPVLIGFKTGAALYIASTQLPKLFGLEGATGNFFSRVAQSAWLTGSLSNSCLSGGCSHHDGRDCEAVENSHLKFLCLKHNCSWLQLVPGACLSSICRCELFCSDSGRTKA
jgi:MFS superfamily sulfate permease-like transporter